MSGSSGSSGKGAEEAGVGVGVVAVTESGGVKRARPEGDSVRPPAATSTATAATATTIKTTKTTTDGTTRKKHETALIGNYAHYYGYRCGASAGEDRRLALLPGALFAGRECLDVGCNSGVLTLALARRHRPAVMIGVDADAALIERARRSKAACGDARAQHAVSYFVEDFVARPTGRGQYDTVTCLSVTKWVQLAHGDAGVRTLFRKAHAMLRDDVAACGGRAEFATGVLVLEPQPWRSYRRRARLSPAMRATYASLQLRPDAFVPLLLGEIGFAAVVTLYAPPAARPDGSRITGFEQRPIYAFLKKVPVPAPLPGSSGTFGAPEVSGPSGNVPVNASEHAESAGNSDNDGLGNDDDDGDDDAPEEIPFVVVREAVQSEAAELAAAAAAAAAVAAIPSGTAVTEAMSSPAPTAEGDDKNEM